jgi:hypothetical protein
MFNKKNFIQLSEEVFLYKNFIDKTHCDIILQETQKLSDEAWDVITETGRKISKVNVNSLFKCREKIRSLLNPDCMLGDSLRVQKIIKGGWGPDHTDNSQFLEIIKANSLYNNKEKFDLKQNSYYGTVFYFNEFTGGNLFYPNQNFKYHPEPGDLVIHSSEEIARHGIEEVDSTVRYSYANHIYKYVKVPKGYFDVV